MLKWILPAVFVVSLGLAGCSPQQPQNEPTPQQATNSTVPAATNQPVADPSAAAPAVVPNTPSYTVTYNKTEMDNWKEVVNNSSDVLLNITKQDGDIVVKAEQLPPGITTAKAYAEAKRTQLLSEGVKSDISEVYEWTDPWEQEGGFFRATIGSSGEQHDETHYYAVHQGTGFSIICLAYGKLSDGIINEFEGVFLDHNFKITPKN